MDAFIAQPLLPSFAQRPALLLRGVPKPPQTKFKDTSRRLRRSRPGSSKRWF
jgi:hypothetical protein